MRIQRVEKDNGSVKISYKTTWPLFYEVMLCAAEELIETDFKDKLARLAIQNPGGNSIECLQEYLHNDKNIWQCPNLCKERGCIIIAGYSHIMECDMQITLYNQTKAAVIQTSSIELVEKNGNEVFSNYMSSLEINTYVRHSNKTFHDKSLQDFKKLPFIKKVQLLFGK